MTTRRFATILTKNYVYKLDDCLTHPFKKRKIWKFKQACMSKVN